MGGTGGSAKGGEKGKKKLRKKKLEQYIRGAENLSTSDNWGGAREMSGPSEKTEIEK